MPVGTTDERVHRLLVHLQGAIVGREWPLKLALVALFSGGHALLEDVPGVGKTLIARTLARAIGGKFQRIQFTPDLLPADVTGSSLWNPQRGGFEFVPGPVFANVLLADEINRATPRTQSALLEVMEEQQVTTDGVSRPLADPFFVVATQNPVEYQGTFPLPEAQLDRFALSFSLGYPSEAEELEMLRRQLGSAPSGEREPALTPEDVIALRQACAAVAVTEPLQRYVLALVRATREDGRVALGVSPRGALALQRAAQSFAYLEGRDFVLPDDVKAIAPHVLAHRLVVSATGVAAAELVERLVGTTPIP
jgi:MoxR-like ATPase